MSAPVWKCEIERVSNGYIFTSYIPEEEDEYVIEKELFTDYTGKRAIYTGGTTEIKSFVELVWMLAEYYGVLGSKHDEKRFWVGVRDKNDKCLEFDDE